MRAICKWDQRVNYTLALLIGCACEMLAAARGERHRGDHKSLEEILDPGWRPLAKPLFDALRNGLAHGYDTKHILFREKPYQIHMSWNARVPLEVTRGGAGLQIGPRLLAEGICKKIDDLEALLKVDPRARLVWYQKAHRYDREIRLGTKAEAAFQLLLDARAAQG